MSELGFVIETLPDGRRVKQRDNGLRGLAVADEAVLWDALQAVLARENELYTANARLAEEAHQAQLALAEMRAQAEGEDDEQIIPDQRRGREGRGRR